MAQQPNVRELALTPLKANGGSDGFLVAVEQQRQVPFGIARAYYIWGVPTGATRGKHAHRSEHQFFICLQGACRFTCDDGTQKREFLLDRPDVGLYVPPLIWGEQTYEKPDALALVLASQKYDRADYIENYQEYVRIVRAASPSRAGTQCN